MHHLLRVPDSLERTRFQPQSRLHRDYARVDPNLNMNRTPNLNINDMRVTDEVTANSLERRVPVNNSESVNHFTFIDVFEVAQH